MAVLQVLHIPDERLRIVAEPVKEVNAEIQRIVDDMFETMYAEEGIGLAATQVDIHKRIIVIDVSENREERLVLINPELLEKSGETVTVFNDGRDVSLSNLLELGHITRPSKKGFGKGVQRRVPPQEHIRPAYNQSARNYEELLKKIKIKIGGN